MPRRLDVPCKHPGCPKLVPYGSHYCTEHEALHRGAPVLFWDESNWQSLCKTYHDKKTKTSEYRF